MSKWIKPVKHLFVRYKVKADRAAESEACINAVFAKLQHLAPRDVHHDSFKLEDGVSFVPIASFSGPDGHNPLPELSAFKAFTQDIASRCEEPPVAMAADAVGSHRVFE